MITSSKCVSYFFENYCRKYTPLSFCLNAFFILMVRLLLKLDYLIIFVISHNYFIISCHIWSLFFFVNYLSSSSCIFFVFPYIMYSYILDIVLSFSFGGHFLYGNSVSPYCFPLPTVLLHIVFF